MMFMCDDCGLVFEKPGKWTESYGQEMYGCPGCYASFRPVKKCKCCGERYTDDDYCFECRMEVKETFEHFVDLTFSKEQRELLNEMYEGKPI